MCGIAGLVHPSLSADSLTQELTKMTDAIFHRGPDDAGHFLLPERGLAMGFRRLSILELSQDGHQPMHSPDGRFTLTFNGEIYNYRELRTELEKENPELFREVRGHSDTAVFLASVRHWGLEQALTRFVGMFGFALVDRKNLTLSLGRDRAGEKPVYFGWANGFFAYASELKAVTKLSGWNGTIYKKALNEYVSHNCIPAPLTIYENFYKIPPASFLTLKLDADLSRAKTWNEIEGKIVRYWKLPSTNAEMDFATAEKTLESKLKESLTLQMHADVPLGALLSGGIDSSLLVSIACELTRQKIKTFTVGFHEKEYDESPYAKKIAEFLGTEHHALTVEPKEIIQTVPQIAHIYDEPFADSSQIPTFLVFRYAKQFVTVALSGDGADELFGGYTRYGRASKLWQRSHQVPHILRKIVQKTVEKTPPFLLEKALKNLRGANSLSIERQGSAPLLEKIEAALKAKHPYDLYSAYFFNSVDAFSAIAPENRVNLDAQLYEEEAPSVVTLFQKHDFYRYLPNDILTKVDRAAMAVSLESRAPYLDHRVVDFAFSLKSDLHYKNGTGKQLLRRLLEKRIPSALFERPKVGFGIPIGEWLKGPLKNWAWELLKKESIQKTGAFNTDWVQTKWENHQAERENTYYSLWNILMYQAWALR